MTQQQGTPEKPSEGLETLIGKVVAEPEFRQQMIDDPQTALRNAGITLSPQEMEAVTSTSREEREQMMTQLADRTSPGCWFATSTNTGNWW